MTSYFPYYLALFGLLFFISVICCCIKLIDIIDRPVPRPSTIPAWNYANYLQNSPVAVLSPQQPDTYLRCAMLAENHGLTIEEYLTATTTGPGLYTSTSRDAISAQYANSIALNNQQNQHSQVHSHTLSGNILPPNTPSPQNPQNCYRIPVPDMAVQPTPSPRREQRDRSRQEFRQSSLREVGVGGRRELRPSRSRSSMREQGRQNSQNYDDVCFDV